MCDLRLIWSRCLNPILKWKNRGRSHHGLTDFISSHLVPRAFLDCDWSMRGIKSSSFVIWGQTWPYGRVGSVCWADPCKMSSSRTDRTQKLQWDHYHRHLSDQWIGPYASSPGHSRHILYVPRGRYSSYTGQIFEHTAPWRNPQARDLAGGGKRCDEAFPRQGGRSLWRSHQ